MRLNTCVFLRVEKKSMNQLFTVQKNLPKKILPMACIGEIGENFLLAKISTYTVVVTCTCT